MESETAIHNDHYQAGRKLGLSHLKLGMWIFIASEVMFFGGLIAAFLNFKINFPASESELLNITLVGINTFILLTSSFTVVLSLDAIRGGNKGRLALFLAVTALLGIVFLSGQVYEFYSLKMRD